ncbi:MAG: glycosyltransferase, partial [Chitinophagaceae bacterium]
RFLGYQPYQKISGLLAETHVCVFPSLWENFPNVCLEAMAAGRAVIASNSGGMTDMIENDIHGLLIPPNSPESVANAILSLLQNPSKIRTYGEAARQRVLNEYNENKTGELVTAFYTETISQSQVKAGSPDFA